MESSLVASATTAGQLFSGSTFVVPPYQREYAWGTEQGKEFWGDLQGAVESEEYFLGLIILTEEDERRHIVDGQQRLLTLTLLANALSHEARRHGRRALADRIDATFLTTIDFETDAEVPRLVLADSQDDATLRAILATGEAPTSAGSGSPDGISSNIIAAHQVLKEALTLDLADDPFKRLGTWAEFLMDKLFMAVFVHPDSSSAYRVFEVVNTRGSDLTTADLLKNYVLSQTRPGDRDARYAEWQAIARPLNQAGPSVLVQFIRHITTLRVGHILPRDLFDFIAIRGPSKSDKRARPTVDQLMDDLADNLPLYMQMVDPTLEGPASVEWLRVFDALNELGVISIRPLMLAISKTQDSDAGMDGILRLVVRRIVVGNLGTGNVERIFGDAAAAVVRTGEWSSQLDRLSELNPGREEFRDRVAERSFNKSTLSFLRRCEIQESPTPERQGVLHLIRPRQATDWDEFPLDDFSFWGSTVGNTVLTPADRRPKGATTWDGFRTNMLPVCLDGDQDALRNLDQWSTSNVAARGRRIANSLTAIWYGDD